MIPALRMLFGVLFLCGCWWAMFAWVVILISLLAAMERHGLGVFHLLLPCGLILSGYFVWLNWLAYAARGRFFGASAITVQAVSLLHHLTWLLLLLPPVVRSGFWAPTDVGNVLWLVINILVALSTGLMFWFTDDRITEPTDAADSR